MNIIVRNKESPECYKSIEFTKLVPQASKNGNALLVELHEDESKVTGVTCLYHDFLPSSLYKFVKYIYLTNSSYKYPLIDT